jgi:hypothetical protein
MNGDSLYRHQQRHTPNNSWWLKDAKGIELSRVCDECLADVRSQYAPEVLGAYGRYEDVVDEPIEPDQ